MSATTRSAADRQTVLLGITYTTPRHAQVPQTTLGDTPARRALRAPQHLRASLALRTTSTRPRSDAPDARLAPAKQPSRVGRTAMSAVVLTEHLGLAELDGRYQARSRSARRRSVRRGRPRRESYMTRSGGRIAIRTIRPPPYPARGSRLMGKGADFVRSSRDRITVYSRGQRQGRRVGQSETWRIAFG
jgi:hypothetical protein